MLEEELLREVQGDIPIVRKPFLSLAEKLGVSESKVISTLKLLKEKGLIRQISPIYDTRAVGYDSSLVAFRVKPEKLEEVANFISTHPGVSHNYEREYPFNLWFTIATPPDSILGLEGTVSLIADITNTEDYIVLRTVKTYKIGVKLDYSSIKEKDNTTTPSVSPVSLSRTDRRIINLTQRDIPLRSTPFDSIAEKLGVGSEQLLQRLNFFKEKGVIRRFSAILYHRRVGFRANGMVVWKIPPERVDEVGSYLSQFKSVSHCYLRTTNGLWSYNLFSMVHGRNRKEVLNFAKELEKTIEPEDYRVLFSRREFKKRRVKLFSEEFYEWEKKHVGHNAHKREDFARSTEAIFHEGF